MFRTGFHGSSVRDIAAAAGAPQGSFTNHFASKEAFAEEVLDLYFGHVRGLVAQALEDRALAPSDRLRRYLDLIIERLAADNHMRGCLIGDFSIETAPVSERLRGKLQAIWTEWLKPFSHCIAEAQEAGELSATFASDDLADFLIASWQGAILRSKVEQSAAPLERFKRIVFATVFKSPEENAK